MQQQKINEKSKETELKINFIWGLIDKLKNKVLDDFKDLIKITETLPPNISETNKKILQRTVLRIDTQIRSYESDLQIINGNAAQFIDGVVVFHKYIYIYINFLVNISMWLKEPRMLH